MRASIAAAGLILLLGSLPAIAGSDEEWTRTLAVVQDQRNEFANREADRRAELAAVQAQLKAAQERLRWFEQEFPAPPIPPVPALPGQS